MAVKQKKTSSSRHWLTDKVSVVVWKLPGDDDDCYTAVLYGPGYTSGPHGAPLSGRGGPRYHQALGMWESGRYYWLELYLPECRLGRRLQWDKVPPGIRETIEVLVEEE